ncbi:hypothetical protein [Daejeonella oryzae]|uniref:hypothetical protein n=1 Tax=Daejeonella oryzae TaxID=1122943 RepID=UPI000422E59D|nr:hypothetical protein [Daejeonella oryzae]
MASIFKSLLLTILLFLGGLNSFAEKINPTDSREIKSGKADSTETRLLANKMSTESVQENLPAEQDNIQESPIADQPAESNSENNSLNEETDSEPSLSSQNESASRTKIDVNETRILNKTSFYKMGAIITVLGFVFGFMFGRIAFLMATTGLIFIIIGYLI